MKYYNLNFTQREYLCLGMICCHKYLYSEANKNDSDNLHITINTMKVIHWKKVEKFMGSNQFIDYNQKKRK